MLAPSQGSGGFNAPVGTILPYTGELSKIPHGWALCDGSNGTPNLTGRFLEGVTTDIGQFKQPGLPNIIGRFVQDSGYGSAWADGSFRLGDTVPAFSSQPGGDFDSIYNFDASRSSPVYGRSSTVQPASYTVYYIMRIW